MISRKISLFLVLSLLLIGGLTLSASAQENRFSIVENKAEQRVDILIDGKPFTSYIYPKSLMKPVLYPIRSAKNTLITRGWPMDPRPGERVDHPHHVGMWFNYGNVNGLDFWNNSNNISEERKSGYGTIKHISVHKMIADNNKAELEVSSYWQRADGSNLIKENTKYIFTGNGKNRAIELVTQLTALDEDVSFMDNKEGLLGLRLARELEHPSDKPGKFTDSNGIAVDEATVNNEGVTGVYRSSEGIEGDAVWATRAKWVNLNGEINDEPLSVVILDNSKNVGYPTYWHARGYGLFAVNPLGQKEFSKGEEELNFKLKTGESITFRYKLLISSGDHLSDEQVDVEFEKFNN